MPSCVPDKDYATISYVGDELGWDVLVSNSDLVVANPTLQTHADAKFVPLTGALSKFEPWRTEIITTGQFESTK